MAKIKIMVDTAADLSEELIKKYDFGVIRFMSVFGETSYETGTDITNAQFYDMLEAADKIPTTSQTPYMNMYEALKSAAKENDIVIYFTISSRASGQNHAAQLVLEDIKEENPDVDIRIIDTLNFSAYIAYAAIETAKRLEQGESVDSAIENSLNDMNKWKVYLLVDDMKYLEKGGRINKTTAVFGSLLDIKPILTIKGGLVEFEDKMRGKKKIYDKLIAKMEEDPEFDMNANRFLLIHSDISAGEELKQKLEDNYGEGCVEMFLEFGPVVGTHVGRGATAVLFRKK